MSFFTRLAHWDSVHGLRLLGIVAALAAGAVLWEPARGSIRDWLGPRTRQVLAQAKGDLNGQGDSVTVLKVQQLDSIILEVYSNDEEGRPTRFRTRIVISGSRNGAFDLKGQTVTLALMDTDGEPGDEILAPTFDYDYVPRLNVYKYNSETGQFAVL